MVTAQSLFSQAELSEEMSLAVQIGDVTTANIGQLKTINVNTLPVRYSDKFYRDLLALGNQNFMKFAYWNGFTVGGVCARIEANEVDGTQKLYIMTINVLPAYRRRGIATKLLEHVLSEAAKDATIKEVYLHVQTSNTDARDFYLKHDFTQTGILEGYYKRIDPTSAFVLSKTL